MGVKTGKVLDYDTCNKHCQQCETSTRLGTPAKDHDCRKNYSGSAKATEPHVATELFKRAPSKGAVYKTLIGDDDSSTIARLRAEVDDTIEKQSDVQHAKRALEGQLLHVKSKHKQLSVTVIKYVQKCFAYAIAQNENDAEGLKMALHAIPGHMFGDHGLRKKSEATWCGYLKDPTKYAHRGLPHGKDLTSPSLLVDLKNVMANFAANASKLCPRGSSQRNEALNNTIGSKAPKIRHYGGSSSQDQRVAAAVAQKNLGHAYVPHVMEKLALSPGHHTQIHSLRMNKMKKRAKAHSRSPKHKRQRVLKKVARAQKLQDKEVREGVQYESGMGLQADCPPSAPSSIPDPVERQELQCLGSISAKQIVVTDVETNSAGENSNIHKLRSS